MSAEIESLADSLEAALHRVETVESSSVRLTAAEVELQECIQQARALLSAVLRDGNRRARLVHLFGGDCFRIARIRAVLDRAKSAAYSQIDTTNQPVHGTYATMCLEACASIEEVLRDLGHDKALSNAKEETRRRVNERRSSVHGVPFDTDQEASGTTALRGPSMMCEPNEAIVENTGRRRRSAGGCCLCCRRPQFQRVLSEDGMHVECGVIGCTTTDCDFCVQKTNSNTEDACEAVVCEDVEERNMLTECRYSLESNFPGCIAQIGVSPSLNAIQQCAISWARRRLHLSSSSSSSIVDGDCNCGLSYEPPVGPLAGLVEDSNTLGEGGCGIESASQPLADTEVGDVSAGCAFGLRCACRAAQALSISEPVFQSMDSASLPDTVVEQTTATGGMLVDANDKSDSACPVGDELVGKAEHSSGAVSVRCNFCLQTSCSVVKPLAEIAKQQHGVDVSERIDDCSTGALLEDSDDSGCSTVVWCGNSSARCEFTTESVNPVDELITTTSQLKHSLECIEPADGSCAELTDLGEGSSLDNFTTDISSPSDNSGCSEVSKDAQEAGRGMLTRQGGGGRRAAVLLMGMAPRLPAPALPSQPAVPVPRAHPLRPLAKERVSNASDLTVAAVAPDTRPTAPRTRAATALPAINHIMSQPQPQLPMAWSNSFQTPTSSRRQCMPVGPTRMLSSDSVGGVKPVPSSNDSTCSSSTSSSSKSSARALQILTGSPQIFPWSSQSLPRIQKVGLVAEPLAQLPCQMQTKTSVTRAKNPWGSPHREPARRLVTGPMRAYPLEPVRRRHSMPLPTEPIAVPMAMRMAH
mmetsp:Transcript_38717/g.76727  ORF Transcript_38717/g.76727 Transcript_38717/m.76727 type:complete len:812 (-) Transcript_38717:283-2718(-)